MGDFFPNEWIHFCCIAAVARPVCWIPTDAALFDLCLPRLRPGSDRIASQAPAMYRSSDMSHRFGLGIIICLRSIYSSLLLSVVVFSNVAASITSSTAAPSVRRGKTFAQANCSHCHSIDKFTRSPLHIAPPFRTLHQRYPVESLESCARSA
jgi:hypothetical protein